MNTRASHRGFARTALVALMLAALMVLPGCALAESIGSRSAGGDGSTGIAIAPSPPEMGAADSAAKNSQESLAYDAAPSTEAQNLTAVGADAAAVPSAERLVVRSMDVRLKVDDVESAAIAVRKAAEKRKGIVVDFQVSTDDGVPVYRPYAEGDALADGTALAGYITVRVPADQLTSFSEEIAGLGKVLRQAENEQDVTQEHVDLKARLVNLQATEARLREFFDKAKNVTEMLAIEQELSRVRGDIESLQAQIAYLERQAAMSTVTIELTGPAPIVQPAGEDWGFAEALRQSLRGFVGTINILIVLAGTLAPLLIIGYLVFLVVRSLVRRRRERRTDPSATDPSIDESASPTP